MCIYLFTFFKIYFNQNYVFNQILFKSNIYYFYFNHICIYLYLSTCLFKLNVYYVTPMPRRVTLHRFYVMWPELINSTDRSTRAADARGTQEQEVMRAWAGSDASERAHLHGGELYGGDVGRVHHGSGPVGCVR